MKSHLLCLAVILQHPCIALGHFLGLERQLFSSPKGEWDLESDSYNPLVLRRCEQAGAGPGNGLPPLHHHALILANLSWEFSSPTRYICSGALYCGGLICITSLAGGARNALMPSAFDEFERTVSRTAVQRDWERLETQYDKMRFVLAKPDWSNWGKILCICGHDRKLEICNAERELARELLKQELAVWWEQKMVCAFFVHFRWIRGTWHWKMECNLTLFTVTVSLADRSKVCHPQQSKQQLLKNWKLKIRKTFKRVV